MLNDLRELNIIVDMVEHLFNELMITEKRCFRNTVNLYILSLFPTLSHPMYIHVEV